MLKPPQYQNDPPHNVKRNIPTNGPPVYQEQRCFLIRYCRNSQKMIFYKMTKQGIICQPSKSQWLLQVRPIIKQGKLERIVVDYRQLNAITTPELWI